jgi:hypothetical protein
VTAVPGHRARPEALEHIVVPALSSGVVLGRDHDGRPVVVRLFRTEPTLVALVGGWWAARVVAFRALAVGARIALHPATAAHWHGFAGLATSPDGQPRVHVTDQPLALAASRHQPVLYIYDAASTGGAAPQGLGPWCTELAVLGQLSPAGARAVAGAHLSMVQPLTPPEAAVAAPALHLTGETAGHLQSMTIDMAALFGGGANRYVWWAATRTEQHYLGAPSR